MKRLNIVVVVVAFTFASINLLVGSVPLAQKEDIYKGSWKIVSPVNSSLCIRTEAYKPEGGIMRLIDCDKDYQPVQPYNGQLRHNVYEQSANGALKIVTMFPPSPSGFGIFGDLCAQARYVRVFPECLDELNYWNVELISSEGDVQFFSWRNQVQDLCVAATNYTSGAEVELVTCDTTDINQLWNIDVVCDSC